MTIQETASIIKGCQAHDRKCQEQLYRAYYAYGITVALHYVNQVEEAKVIYNEAMLKVFVHIDKSEGIINFKAWLRKVVVNSAIDYTRKYYQAAERHIEELHSVADRGNDASVLSHLIAEDILSVVQQIPVSYRTVFLLHSVEGYKFHEIADHLQITESGAKTLYYKAKVKLQTLLAAYNEP